MTTQKISKVIGVNWHWLDLAMNNWQGEEAVIKNDVAEINAYLDGLDGDEVFAIETSNDHLFEATAMKRGFSVYWIHTTVSRRCIEAIFLGEFGIDEAGLKQMKKNDKSKAHKLSAYVLRKTFQDDPDLFFLRPPLDPVVTELRMIARDRLYIQDMLNSMTEHTNAHVKNAVNCNVVNEDGVQRMKDRSDVSNEFYKAQKKDIDKELLAFFEKHKDHPVIKAVYWGFFAKYKHVPKLSVALIIGETYDIRRFPNKSTYVQYCRMTPTYSKNGVKLVYDKAFFTNQKVQRNGRAKRAYTDLTGVGQGINTGMLKPKHNPELCEFYQKYVDKYQKTEYAKNKVNRARFAVASWMCKQVYKNWKDAIK